MSEPGEIPGPIQQREGDTRRAAPAAASAPAHEERSGPREPVMKKVPKAEFLGKSGEDQKRDFIGLSGNDQDYLLHQFTEEETESFWGHFTTEEKEAFERLQNIRKATDPDNGMSLGDRQELVAPDIDQEGKEFVHDLDKLLEEGRTSNGGLNNIDAVKPLLAIDGMTKKDAIAMLKSKDITDPETVTALTAGLVDFDELITQGRTQTGGLSNIDAVKPLLAGMTKKEAMQLLGDKNITNPATLASLTADLEDGDEPPTLKEKEEEAQQTREVWEKQMAEADERLEAHKLAHPDQEEKINALQRKMRNFSTMFSDFFAENEPGREYLRKGKKWLYYLLVTAIVFLLMECNLIYKAAAGRRK